MRKRGISPPSAYDGERGLPAKTMDAIYQGLKSMDRRSFERFCFHLLKKRYPHYEIRHVDGAAGDEGIDVFAGDLDDGPIIWQCKHFPDGVRESQKQRIRDSLKTLTRNCSPKVWTLCVPIDLDTAAHRWFQRLAQSYSETLRIGLMQAGDMVEELVYWKELRDVYFPNAVLDVMQLRALIARTNTLTTDELAALTSENANQYIDRLRAQDSRFDYEVNFSRNGRRPVSIDDAKGAIAAVSDGDKTVRVYARDVEALRSDPPKSSFTFSETGRAKMEQFIRRGGVQDFEPGEIESFDSDLSFLMPDLVQAQMRMSVRQSIPEVCIATRVTFGAGPTAVIYPLLEFKLVRSGTEEAEYVSIGEMPFEVRLLIHSGRPIPGSLKCESHIVNADVGALRSWLRAVDVLRNEPVIELFDLRMGNRLALARVPLDSLPPRDSWLATFIENAAAVAEHYGVQFRLPDLISEADAKNIKTLIDFMRGADSPVSTISFKLRKIVETTPQILHSIREYSTFQLRTQSMSPPPVVFGIPIDTGTMIWQLDRARLKNRESFANRLKRSAIGTSIDASLQIAGPVRVWALGRSEVIQFPSSI